MGVFMPKLKKTKQPKLVVRDKGKKNMFWPSPEMKKRAWISDKGIYDAAADNPLAFWENRAREGISWFKEWNKVYEAKPPYFKWFVGATLNASYNCLDRHVEAGNGNDVALIWEPEPVDEEPRVFTYSMLLEQVSKFANVLKSLGVRKGDRVGIYLPMLPEVHIAMLACARIGAMHSVVFSAFSPESLKKRLIDAEAKVLIISDGYYRRGKKITLKERVDPILGETKVRNVVVVKRFKEAIELQQGRDLWWQDLIVNASPDCAPEQMDSESTLFILYTSGTTGKPKGILHDTGGYLTQAYWTSKLNFDLHPGELIWCTADIGWITGHTYTCYGPYSLGVKTLIYEGAPDFPKEDRFWEIVEKYRVTVFYTAPTAIRMFAKIGAKHLKKHDLSSIRILGTVGEPIDEAAWMWYFENVGNSNCPVIDTWWQTETGGTLINALPGIGPFIPTVAGKSFPGTKHILLDEEGKEVHGDSGGYLVQLPPFAPGMLRGVYKNPAKYLEEYWGHYGKEIYYTSDGARYENGFFRITGRVDDVMKVAGHRLSTAEVENAIENHAFVSECAVVPMEDSIKGHVPVAFVVLKKSEPSEHLEHELVQEVVKAIGPTAKPKEILFVDDLPKTRSGKIMRRLLRKMLAKKEVGDTTTLQNPESVEHLQKAVRDFLHSDH
ncbi:MAG: acetate--CoA ligase [Candidatus Diapherotrites archaeon]|nr:acetate--CoA ligase [Candidatus Diapherotrites archaeon]